jgi:hypothetical protein
MPTSTTPELDNVVSLVERLVRPGYKTSEFAGAVVTTAVGVGTDLVTFFDPKLQLSADTKTAVIGIVGIVVSAAWTYFAKTRAGVKAAALAPHVVQAVASYAGQADAALADPAVQDQLSKLLGAHVDQVATAVTDQVTAGLAAVSAKIDASNARPVVLNVAPGTTAPAVQQSPPADPAAAGTAG